MVSENPYTIIERRFNRTEDLLLKVINKLEALPNTAPGDFDFIPIQKIFQAKLLSKPALYDRARRGEIQIFKIGNKSFVNREQFEKLFRKVSVRPVERLSRKDNNQFNNSK